MAEYNSNKGGGEDSITRQLKLIALIIGIIGTMIGIMTGAIVIYKNVEEAKPPTFVIENKLTLPIIVTINDSHTKRIRAGDKQTITLLSDAEFPANVKWKVQRNKNNNNQPIGEEIGNEIKRVDKGTILAVDNEIELTTYFYPIIMNNTDSKCTIIVNDGLSIKYTIGTSSPHTTANITGYYKYATNSNITLKCKNVTYYRGERNGEQGPPIKLSAGSGIVEIPIP